jgi:hypothetical protein
MALWFRDANSMAVSPRYKIAGRNTEPMTCCSRVSAYYCAVLQFGQLRCNHQPPFIRSAGQILSHWPTASFGYSSNAVYIPQMARILWRTVAEGAAHLVGEEATESVSAKREQALCFGDANIMASCSPQVRSCSCRHGLKGPRGSFCSSHTCQLTLCFWLTEMAA